MKNDFLSQFYSIDPLTGGYIVDVSLKNYKQIFNTWDSSVYNIRDLDTSLKAFLLECGNDIVKKAKIILRFNIKNQEQDKETEEIVKESIKSYFKYSIHSIQGQLLERRRKAVFYAIISLCFLTLTFLLQEKIATNIGGNLIIQSFTIGGWIFLWEAFSSIFINSSGLSKSKKIFKKLSSSDIVFKY